MLCLSHHYYGWLSPYPQKLQNKTAGVWQNSLCQQVAWPIICFVTRPDSSSEFESFFISQVQWDQNGGLDLTPNPFHNGSLSLFYQSCKSFVLSIKAFAFFGSREIPENQSDLTSDIFFKSRQQFCFVGFCQYLLSDVFVLWNNIDKNWDFSMFTTDLDKTKGKNYSVWKHTKNWCLNNRINDFCAAFAAPLFLIYMPVVFG